jgi:hypothetical protein
MASCQSHRRRLPQDEQPLLSELSSFAVVVTTSTTIPALQRGQHSAFASKTFCLLFSSWLCNKIVKALFREGLLETTSPNGFIELKLPVENLEFFSSTKC